MDGWSVSVEVWGELILAISDRDLCGKADLTEDDKDAIRTAAKHLIAFVGDEEPGEGGMNIYLSSLTPAPWEVYETGTFLDTNHFYGIKAIKSPVGVVAKVEGFGVGSKADAEFIALARNAFDGDPEALAWWEEHRNRREPLQTRGE